MNDSPESDHLHDLLSVCHDEDLMRLRVRLMKKGKTVLADILRNEMARRDETERRERKKRG